MYKPVQQFKHLTQDQCENYASNGYTVVPDFLSSKELEECLQAVESFKMNACADDPDTEFGAAGMLERVRYATEKHQTFNRLLHSEKLLDCIEDLLGPSFRHIPQSKLNCKPGGGGAAIPFHQDWAHFPHTNSSVLTACILFNDTDRENGCLQVVPGSNHGPIHSHHDKNNKFAAVITDRPYLESISPVHLSARAGSMTIHNARTVHGSAANQSNRPRGALCLIFTAADAWPLCGIAYRPWSVDGDFNFEIFKQTMLRGEVSLSVRMEDVPVLLPAPFGQDDSVILDGDTDIPMPQ